MPVSVGTIPLFLKLKNTILEKYHNYQYKEEEIVYSEIEQMKNEAGL
jgi:hypothetical protein